MIYRDFLGEKISLLGFGAMRMPLISSDPNSPVDEEHVARMIDYALKHGVNYFDSAYPYHGGQSDRILGDILSKYPRDSYYLATKYPGHQIAEKYDPAGVFEEQLKNCKVDYFDFYLYHNIYEECLDVYLDPQWGIMDYFVEQKKLGRIKHLGFSTHFLAENLRPFLEKYGHIMDFCQIQLNYMDWTLQNAKEKVEMLNEYNLPIIVMEPLRGGKLAKLSEENEAKLKALRPDASIPSWSFRWLQEVPSLMTILSGMSNMEQLIDNVATFESENPLNEAEKNTLYEIADSMMNNIPCTGCRYCTKGCPQELNIPMLLDRYNEARFMANINLGMTIDSLPEDKRPSACIECGQCTQVCPQKIDIPVAMKDFQVILSKLPNWKDICREREAIALKSKEEARKNA